MELGLIQKQTTSLVMTTELRQAIALLQFSTIDLAQFVKEQAIENPLIELEEKPIEGQIKDTHDQSYTRSSHAPNQDNAVDPIDFIASKKHGQCNDLLEQVQYLTVSKEERSLLRYLILNLDDNGYLSLQPTDIATSFGATEQAVHHGINILQQLEPVGVGTRDLRECLHLQAMVFYPDNPLVAHVIKNHLELLAVKKWQEIAKNLNTSLHEVKDVADCITTLNPRPCSNLFDSEPNYVYPDITIEKINGKYTVTLNDHYLPKIHLNQHYMSLKSSDTDTANYIKNNHQKYQWLIKSIEQRKSTILKITEAIIQNQHEFLENGFSHLQPITLKEIAEKIDMHESTVSRATNNKVITTPNGSYEMRRLFTSKLGKDNNSHASSAQVKSLLKQFINEEDRKRPLSDQKLADYFKKENGITVSRRTVAKYREELNILSSAKRKSIV